MTNPESAVIDAIDVLVDESLSVGPVDDYNADRYPRCDRCSHHWHGLTCNLCGCGGSRGERVYVDQIIGVRYSDSCSQRGYGYAIADVEAMRSVPISTVPISTYRYYEYFADQVVMNEALRLRAQ